MTVERTRKRTSPSGRRTGVATNTRWPLALTLMAITSPVLACRVQAPATTPSGTTSAPSQKELPTLPALRIASCSDDVSSAIVADQLSRVAPASAVALSDDGELAITTGSSATSVWDLRTFRRIDVDAGVRGDHVVFAGTGQTALLVDRDGKLWRRDGGQWRALGSLWNLGLTGRILALHAADERTAWIVSEDGLHSIVVEGTVRVAKSVPMGPLTAAAATGTSLVVADARGGIDVLDGNWQNRHHVDTGGDVRRLALSSDGRAVAWSTDDQRVRIRDLAAARDTKVSSPARFTSPIQGLAFGVDGTQLLVSRADGSVTAHVATTGEASRAFAGRPAPFSIDYASATPIALSAKGEVMATIDLETVRIHDARTLDPLFTAAPAIALGGDLRVSDDGRWLLAGAGSAWVAWDLARLVPTPLVSTATALGSASTSRAYFEGESTAIVVSDAKMVRVDLERGQVESTWDLPRVAGVVDVAYAASIKSVIRVDASGALDIHTIGETSSHRARPLAVGVASAVVSSNGDKFVLLGRDGQLVMIPSQSPTDSKVLATGLSPHSKLQLGSDDRTIVHEHRRWDAETGDEVLVAARFDVEEDPMLAAFRLPSVAATDHEARWHVVGDDTGCVRVVDPRTGRTESHARVFEPGTAVTSLASSSRTGMIFAAARDGRVRAWNSRSGESLTLAATPGAWAAWRDDGYFSASRLGHELFSMNLRGAAVDPIRVATRFNRPGALLTRIQPGGEREDTAAFADVLERAAAARPGAATPTTPGNDGTGAADGSDETRLRAQVLAIDAAGATIQIDVEPPKSPQRAQPVVHIRIDGVRRKDLDVELTNEGRSRETLIPLPSGSHVIEFVLAADKTGDEALGAPTVLVVRSPLSRRAGRLRFFGVGASTYADARIRPLSYADDDVRDVAASMRSAGRLFSEYEETLLPDGATRAEIDAALTTWTSRAAADDVLVVFFAGHGKQVNGQHALLTHDSKLDALSTTTLPISRVHELLNASGSLRRLLLIDTCESGDGAAPDRSALVDAMRRVGIDPSSARGLDFDPTPAASSAPPAVERTEVLTTRLERWVSDRDHLVFAEPGADSGTVTLVSSRGWEPSLEFSSLENGVFSTALLTALTTSGTDVDEDGSASLDELVFVATNAVAELTHDLQHPTLLSSNPRSQLQVPILGAAATSGQKDRPPRPGEVIPSDAVVREVTRTWFERDAGRDGSLSMEPIDLRITFRGDVVVAHVFFRFQTRADASLTEHPTRGTDKRWFALTRASTGEWRVTGMGPSMSGLL